MSIRDQSTYGVAQKRRGKARRVSKLAEKENREWRTHKHTGAAVAGLARGLRPSIPAPSQAEKKGKEIVTRRKQALGKTNGKQNAFGRQKANEKVCARRNANLLLGARREQFGSTVRQVEKFRVPHGEIRISLFEWAQQAIAGCKIICFGRTVIRCG